MWNLAHWEILSQVPGKVLWRKCIGGLGAKIYQLNNRHLCEITRGPPPLKTVLRCKNFKSANPTQVQSVWFTNPDQVMMKEKCALWVFRGFKLPQNHSCAFLTTLNHILISLSYFKIVSIYALFGPETAVSGTKKKQTKLPDGLSVCYWPKVISNKRF